MPGEFAWLSGKHPFASSALVVVIVMMVVVVVMVVMVMMHNHHNLRFCRLRETSHGQDHCQTKEQTYG